MTHHEPGVLPDTVRTARSPDAVGPVVAAEPLRHNAKNDATAGIWRIRGTRGSAVLKVARPPAGPTGGYWPTSDEPTHWNHWRREALAYRSGLAGSAYAAGGIAAPDLLASADRSDGAVELWLADVTGTDGFEWPVADLAGFAYRLGVGQARWAGRTPEYGWLSRRWLGGYLTDGPSRSVDVRDADWDHPLLAAWPRAVRDELRRLWAHRDRALAAAEAAEPTLCHLDVWPANLLAADTGPVLLDWSFVGTGALGEDLANLVLDSFTDGLLDSALLPDLATHATDRYLDGLRDGGWTGPPDAVRAAVARCGAAKYAWLAPAYVGRAVRGDLGSSAYRTQTSPAAVVAALTPVVTLLADWSRTALA